MTEVIATTGTAAVQGVALATSNRTLLPKIVLTVFGGRGSGLLLVDAARRSSTANEVVDIIGFLNDVEPVGTLIGGIPVVGAFEQWGELDTEVRFVAPLHKAGDMANRIARIESLGMPDERWVSIVDPTVVVSSDVQWRTGCFLAPYSIVKPGVRLGRHIALRDQASIGHDTTVEDYAFIGTGASLGGYCHVERGAFIGMNASVRDNITIGAMAVVGMGAVVVKDVPAGATVVGNPAMPIKRARRRE